MVTQDIQTNNISDTTISEDELSSPIDDVDETEDISES